MPAGPGKFPVMLVVQEIFGVQAFFGIALELVVGLRSLDGARDGFGHECVSGLAFAFSRSRNAGLKLLFQEEGGRAHAVLRDNVAT